MNLLQEIIGYYNLTDSQKTILVACIISGTAQQAYEFTIGNPQLVQSRNTLVRIGLINVQGNQMALTSKGEDAARNYNLTDETGQLTTDATELIQGKNSETESNTNPSQNEVNVSQ